MCMSPDYAIVIVLVVQNVYIQKWTNMYFIYFLKSVNLPHYGATSAQ